jgi:hypothetical protein
VSRRRRDEGLDWLDEDETGQATSEPASAAGTDLAATTPVSPRALLEQIANNPDQPASARVQAAKALHDMGVVGTEDAGIAELMAWVATLSGKELDAEIAGFFNPGYAEREPTDDERIEQEVERRMKRIRHSIKRYFREQRAEHERRILGRKAAWREPEVLSPTAVLDPATAGNDGVHVDLASGKRTELVRRPTRYGQHGRTTGFEVIEVPAPDTADPAVLWGDGPGVTLGEKVTHAKLKEGRPVGEVRR